MAVDPAALPASTAAPSTEGWTAEEIQALADLGISQDEIAELMGREQNAMSAARGSSPQGRYAGGTFQAANPLEFLGEGIRRWRGGNAVEDLRGQIGDKRAEQAQTRAEMMRRILGPTGAPGAPPAGQVPVPQNNPSVSIQRPQQPSMAPPMQGGGVVPGAMPAPPQQSPVAGRGIFGMGPGGIPRRPAPSASPVPGMPQSREQALAMMLRGRNG